MPAVVTDTRTTIARCVNGVLAWRIRWNVSIRPAT